MDFAPLILASAFVSVFALGEALFRAGVLGKEHARKFTHVAAGVLAMAAPRFVPYGVVVLLAVAFALALALLRGKRFLASITTSDRRTHGTWLMPVGIAFTAFFFPVDSLYVPAIGVLAFADAAAGIAGRGKNGKTSAGSAAFFAVSLAVLLPSGTGVADAVLASAVLAVLERLCPRGTDNLALPLAAGALLRVLA